MESLELNQIISRLYDSDDQIQNSQRKRYERLLKWRQDLFGEREEKFIISTPGRTEIGGNHTDHNHGRVLAGSVNLDSIAIASPANDNKARLYSRGFEKAFEVQLDNLTVQPSERESTCALIRGMAAGLHQAGYQIGGFDACLTSDVLPGSGLSSSASIEVLIGTIFNALFNENRVKLLEIAKIGQYAENEYFGKPCGLMDQVACATGGVVGIDFEDPAKPMVQQVEFSLKKHRLRMVIVNTGGSHADLTAEYAAIPSEMKKIAGYYGKSVCRQISANQVLSDLPDLRRQFGDRAVLRALHFLEENDRVGRQIKAIRNDDIELFMKEVNRSGNSSFKFLQNAYVAAHPEAQPISLGLALSERFFNRVGAGACRVHGGGFAGTILAIIPIEQVNDYCRMMERVFGKGSAIVTSIRFHGTTAFRIS